MNDAPAAPTPSAEERRRRFLAHAAAAYDLMFAPAYQDQLVTFDQREERACELGRDLTAWLLQQHANADPVAQPAPEAVPPPSCPKCGRPGRWVTGPDEPPPARRLTTRTGAVTLHRHQARCTACRVVFFPPGPEAPARDGGV
jgi:hypothetical protein